MSRQLRILHLEDDPDYVDLVRASLEKEGVESALVHAANRAEFEAALARETFDLILADYLLPGYNGLDALGHARGMCPDTPFLIVSGTIGEQAAISSLTAGATDYVLKQWPERLVPAIRRAVQEARERKRNKDRDAAFTKLGYALSSASSPLEAARVIQAVTDDLFQWDAFTLNFYSAEQDRVYSVLNVDTDRDDKRFEIPFCEDGQPPSPRARRIIEHGAELILRQDHPAAPEDAVLIGDTTRPSASLMLAPIRNRSQVIGILSVQSYRPKAYDSSDLTLLQALADHCGGAFERIRAETTQKCLEDQLRQAQKMEAIGQLAGGIAHDFNNILTVIHGHASLLLAAGELTQSALHSAQQINQAAGRAAVLTRQLLAFSRRQVMQLRLLDVNEVAGNMTKMLSRILGEDIALRMQYSLEPALVQADAGMLEQTLLNLALNSRDAMPRGGLLMVKISVAAINAASLPEHPEGHPGRFVCLSVTDTGCGIAPEHLRHVFEPFFTTKEVGKGTGLGLAMVYGIVKQHRGWIELDSEPGQGATFRIFLPLSYAPVPQPPADPFPAAPRGGSETILVVEDETAVRDLVCRFLAQCGYRILQADSGPKAIEVWQAHKKEIDLVLTDLIMPDRMNGRELVEKMWAEQPGLKVIFTTGYCSETLGKDYVLPPGLNCLQKPYPPQKLASLVRDCLDAGKPTPSVTPSELQSVVNK